MKNFMIFAAMMCCMVSASAQQAKHKLNVHKALKDKAQQTEKWNRYENTYSEKLDSVYADFERAYFAYDERFNCVKMDYYTNWGDWMLDFTEVYTYDEKDRIIMLTMTADEFGDKSEYTYNDEGWLSEELEYELEDGDWLLVNKYTYEYDANGHMVLSMSYAYYGEWFPESKMTWEYEGGLLRSDMYYYYDGDDEEWWPNMRNDYIYNTEGLCTKTLRSYWEGEWVESYKIEYEYDAEGNRISATTSNRYDLGDWIYSDRTEYGYDANRNCIGRWSYYYNSELEEWENEGMNIFTYDLSTPVTNTAGIFMIWDNELQIYNKVLGWEYEFGDEIETVDLYYSSCEGVNEMTESPLNLWPNPVSESLSLNAKDLQQAEIFSMDGKQVMHLENGFETINVSTLAKGCYLLKVTFADGSKAAQKFVKE